jgi:hypothetical protein
MECKKKKNNNIYIYIYSGSRKVVVNLARFLNWPSKEEEKK